MLTLTSGTFVVLTLTSDMFVVLTLTSGTVVGKGGLKKMTQDSAKPGRRKKPKTLAKSSVKARKGKGEGSRKKNADGTSRENSQEVVKQRNSSDFEGDRAKAGDTMDDSFKCNPVAVGSRQTSPNTNSTKTGRTGRNLKVVRVVARSEDSMSVGQGTNLDNPPSPARSCDSFSSNEPLTSLKRDVSEVTPDCCATDQENMKDETHKKECVAAVVVSTGARQTGDVPCMSRAVSADGRTDKHSCKPDGGQNTEISGNTVQMKDISVAINPCDRIISCRDKSSTDTGRVGDKTNGVAAATMPVVDSSLYQPPGLTRAHVAPQAETKSPVHPSIQSSSGGHNVKRKRKYYKRRNALELLNDVDGPPSRTQRMLQNKKMRHVAHQQTDAPSSTPAAEGADARTSMGTESEPEDAPADGVRDRASSTQEETDQVQEFKQAPEVQLPENAADDVAMRDDGISAASSFVEKVGSCTADDVISAVASFVVEKVESCTTNDGKSTVCSVVEKVETCTTKDGTSTASSVVKKVVKCTAHVEKQSTPVGRGKKGPVKKNAGQKVGSAKKGPRKKPGVQQKYKGVKRKYKGVKRKYKGVKQSDEEPTANEPPLGRKRQKVQGEDTAALSKSYSVKRMTTRGKKNRYWYLFAKQTKMRAVQDGETDGAPRSGSVRDMLSVCRPCTVRLVDVLKCLNIGRLTGDCGVSDNEIETPVGETTEPWKVARLDPCVPAHEECVGVVDGDSSSLTSSATGTSSVRTDTSDSPSSCEEADPLGGARIPRTVGVDELLSNRQRSRKPRRRFRCNLCAFKTSLRNVMDEHVYTHTNIEPYSCGHCRRSFSTRDGVVTHTRLEHCGQIFNIVRQKDPADGVYYTVQYVRPRLKAPTPASVDTLLGDGSRVRPRIPVLDAVNPHQPYYQCKRCTHATNSAVTIQHHVLDIHSSDRRLICPLCDRAYCKTGHGMTKHYKRWHPAAAVQLRYEPDYYEVWDVKQAEANGVDAASCTVLSLPGPGGDVGPSDGQPLIGQPLIVQPGQTFLTQKALSSERPQVTQPLMLQPSVRALSRGRPPVLLDETNVSESDAVKGESTLGQTSLTPSHDSLHESPPSDPVCETSTVHRTTNSAMPLLLSVDTYVSPSRDSVQTDQPLALVKNPSHDSRRPDTQTHDAMATSGQEGAVSTPIHGLSTAAVDSPEQQLERSSAGDVDRTLTDDECGAGGLPDTMPHLEKVRIYNKWHKNGKCRFLIKFIFIFIGLVR